MAVNGGLESWWNLSWDNKVVGKIHMKGEWMPCGSDPVSVSAAASPGLQTVIQQQMMAQTMAGTKPKPPPAYQMPAYNYTKAQPQQAPAWAERQFQSAEAVNARGFMG